MEVKESVAHHPAHTHTPLFRSNPFAALMHQLSELILVNPLSSLLLGLFTLLVVLGGAFGLGFITGAFNSTLGNIIGLTAGVLFLVFVVFRFTAASYVIHAASRQNRAIAARDSLAEAMKMNYNAYLLTAIVTNLIVLAATLAFILPGLYFIGRVAFAPYIALDEGLGVVASLKKSWKMSNGHWFEIIGAILASAITIPYGLLSFVGLQSGLFGRYFEISELEKSGAQKPQVHWLNYFIVGIGIVVACVYSLYLVAAIRAIGDDSKSSCDTFSFTDDNSNCSINSTDYSPFDNLSSPAN